MSRRESAPPEVIEADDTVANAPRRAAFETRLVSLTARHDVALASGDEATARAVRDELRGIHSDKLARVDEALCRVLGDRNWRPGRCAVNAADVAAAMGRDLPEPPAVKPRVLVLTADEIDACTDIARLRVLAKQYRDAMIGQHDFAGHALEVEDCLKCSQARHYGDPTAACDEYKAWQAQYMAALGAWILPVGDAR